MAWEVKVSKRDAVKAFMVVNADGEIEVEPSVSKYRESLLQAVAIREAQDTLILMCLGETFDEHKGARLNLAFLVSQVVPKMGNHVEALKDPQLFSMLSKRIAEVLSENCDQPAKEATNKHPACEAITGRTYSSVPYRNGGFIRNADHQ
jgi:hypothetical protein